MFGLLRRLLLAAVCLALMATFVLWRIDSPRVERLRMALLDKALPSFDRTIRPLTRISRLIADYQSLEAVYNQNRELREELQRMKGWREAALQLEEKNARLRALNNVRLSPRLTSITGEVLADSGSPFSQSALLNIGRIDGVQDGAAAVDGLGLVGRVAGVGETTARLMLLTDISSLVPGIIQPSGQRALVTGDNSNAPVLDFLDDPERVQPGDRVFTSGAGGIFPADILVGEVAAGRDGRLRVRMAADYRRLEFIRVLHTPDRPEIAGPGDLIGPTLPAPPLPRDLPREGMEAAQELGQ